MIDLHKVLIGVQASLAVESLDGASVCNLGPRRIGRLRAGVFMPVSPPPRRRSWAVRGLAPPRRALAIARHPQRHRHDGGPRARGPRRRARAVIHLADIHAHGRQFFPGFCSSRWSRVESTLRIGDGCYGFERESRVSTADAGPSLRACSRSWAPGWCPHRLERTRKPLGHFVGKADALAVLRWSAEHGVGSPRVPRGRRRAAD